MRDMVFLRVDTARMMSRISDCPGGIMSKGILDIDAGNTRLKWRLLNEKGDVILSGFDHYKPHYKAVVCRVVDKLPFWPARCRLCCVHTDEATHELASALKNCLELDVESLSSCLNISECELRDTDPKALGADRWLGLLAGRKLCPDKAFMVVDAGTALTLDLCDTKGAYLGGYIVPGSHVHFSGLAEGAQRLGKHCPKRLADGERCPSKSAKGALENGFVTMAASLIEAEYERLKHDVQVILSGGDGAFLAHHLKIPSTYKPDLVLEGLGMALP